MDLTVYYKKIREAEAELPEPCVVVSNETEDGGRAGVRSEVPRRIGARMVVEGRARAATGEEAREFREEAAKAKYEADRVAEASRVRWSVVPTDELRQLRNPQPRE
jgi:hypothetical protein